MAGYYSTQDEHPEDVKLVDISSHIQPTTKVTLGLVKAVESLSLLVPEAGANLIDPSTRKAAEQVKEGSKKYLLQQVIQERIQNYPIGPMTSTEVRKANVKKHKEDERQRLAHGGRSEKLNHQTSSIQDGITTMFSYEEDDIVLVAFEYNISEKLFQKCRVQYDVFGEKYTCPIPTLFKILNEAERLGIMQENLNDVLSCFVRMCLPSKEGSLSSDPRALKNNVEILSKALSVSEEQKKIRAALAKIVRSPGESLDKYTDGLSNLYSMYVYLMELGNQTDVEKMMVYVKDKDSISTDMRIQQRVENIMKVALRNLCSPTAQRNLNAIIRESHGTLSEESKKEALVKVDSQYPIKSPMKLPTTLIYIGYDIQQVNGVSTDEIIGEFGTFSTKFRDSSPSSRYANEWKEERSRGGNDYGDNNRYRDSYRGNRKGSNERQDDWRDGTGVNQGRDFNRRNDKESGNFGRDYQYPYRNKEQSRDYQSRGYRRQNEERFDRGRSGQREDRSRSGSRSREYRGQYDRDDSLKGDRRFRDGSGRREDRSGSRGRYNVDKQDYKDKSSHREKEYRDKSIHRERDYKDRSSSREGSSNRGSSPYHDPKDSSRDKRDLEVNKRGNNDNKGNYNTYQGRGRSFSRESRDRNTRQKDVAKDSSSSPSPQYQGRDRSRSRDASSERKVEGKHPMGDWLDKASRNEILYKCPFCFRCGSLDHGGDHCTMYQASQPPLFLRCFKCSLYHGAAQCRSKITKTFKTKN